MDISRGETVEKELTRLVEKRSPRETDPDEREESWKMSVKRYNAHRQQELRVEWHAYFCRLAACLRARAEEYDKRAKTLMEDQTKGAP